MDALRKTLEDVKTRIARWQGRKLNEENTKATLINPVLRALGWDPEDLEAVQQEYKVKQRDKPVDYALFSERRPVLFVEAKALNQDLKDRRWANQIMGYASVAGAPWVVLTNGDEYQIYNAHAAVPVDRKMFRSVSITGSIEEAESVLSLIVPSRMADNDLEKLWQRYYVDQEVRAAMEELFGTGVSPAALINLVRKHTKGLSPKDVQTSLRRMRVTLDFPPPPPPPPQKRRRSGRKKVGKRTEVSLGDLIREKLIRPPLELHRVYKGHRLSATIEASGHVLFRGQSYDSLSTAGGMARKTVRAPAAGRKYPQTNGWTFWQFVDRDGETKEIDELRKRYLGGKDLKVVGKAETDRETRGGR